MREEFKKYGYSPTHTEVYKPFPAISDQDAFSLVSELALKEGLLVGSSSGAAFKAALIEAEHAATETNIVVIFPDGSERYLSKNIYEGGI